MPVDIRAQHVAFWWGCFSCAVRCTGVQAHQTNLVLKTDREQSKSGILKAKSVLEAKLNLKAMIGFCNQRQALDWPPRKKRGTEIHSFHFFPSHGISLSRVARSRRTDRPFARRHLST